MPQRRDVPEHGGLRRPRRLRLRVHARPGEVGYVGHVDPGVLGGSSSGVGMTVTEVRPGRVARALAALKHTVDGLLPYELYQFRVRALSPLGPGPWSAATAPRRRASRGLTSSGTAPRRPAQRRPVASGVALSGGRRVPQFEQTSVVCQGCFETPRPVAGCLGGLRKALC